MSFHEPRFRNDRAPAAGVSPHLALEARPMRDVGSAFETNHQFAVAHRFARNVESEEVAHAFGDFEVADQYAITRVDGFRVLIHAAAIAVLIPRSYQAEPDPVGRLG